MEANLQVFQGGSVKVLGENKIGGLLVRFSDADDLDLDGQYFDDRTEFGEAKTLSLFYDHGLDEQLGRKSIGSGEVTVTEEGLWYEAQLTRRDKYEAYIMALAEKGKLGFSSGAVGHLVELDEEGKHISQWILGEGSITPEPADSKNVIMSLKSYAKTRKTLPPEEEMSFSEMSSSVASAFRSVHPRSWVIEVYKGHLIVDVEESGFFSLGYKKEGGSFVFDDSPTWTKVEPKSTWIEAKSRREAEKSKTEPQEEVSATVDDPVSEETQPQPAKSKEATETEEVKSMDNEAGKSAITQEQLEAAIKSASEVAAKEAVKAFAEENKVVKAKVESEGAPNIAVIGTEIAKFDHVSIPDMAYMIQIMGKCHKKDPDASAAPSNNLRRALALRLESSEGRDNLEARAHMKSIGMPTKANEVMQSDLASFGDEWVGTSYDANLWHRIRQDTPIIGRIPTVTIPGGAESITIPFTSASPTFYLVAGAADQAANPGRTDDTVTTSKLTTGQRVLSTKKVGAYSGFSSLSH